MKSITLYAALKNNNNNKTAKKPLILNMELWTNKNSLKLFQIIS